MPASTYLRDAAERGAVRALARSPRLLHRAVGIRSRNLAGADLDPAVGAALRFMRLSSGPSFEELPLAQARAAIDHEAKLYAGRMEPCAVVRDVTIPTPEGAIRGRLYRADAGDTDRLLVYFHGGGFVLGGLDSTDGVARFLARYSGVSVLSVEYRLAPEHPFPAAPDDALAAYRFAEQMASDWGHDPELIAVGGDSAGANLATVLCADRQRAGLPMPAFQLLFFPVTDFSRKRASYAEFADGFFLTDRQMEWYTEQYLPGRVDVADPRASPLLAGDLAGLPPAYIAVAGFDVLRDEGEDYARALDAAGVRVALRRHDGLVHAFVNATGLFAAGKEATLEAAGALRMGVGGAGSLATVSVPRLAVGRAGPLFPVGRAAASAPARARLS